MASGKRDEMRVFCADARARCITWNEADKINAIAMKALDDLDIQDAEVARLTAENDRLAVIARADEWQARYWAERDAVADRDATIMAERAQSAAMRRALESLLSKHPNGHWYSQQTRMADEEGAALQSGAGKALLDAPAAELKEIGEQLEADRTATADGVTAIKRAVASRRWLAEDGRGSYEWDDDRYRGEFRQAVAEIETALGPLAKIAADWQNCPRTGPAIVKARQDLKSANVALRQRVEAAEANLIEARKAAEGHREPCYYCGKPINNLAAFPGEWSVGLCHGDDPGRLKWHHVSCVSERLARLEAAEIRPTCDGSTERAHTESTKAAIAALWETNPEIAYESPAQVIAWLKGRTEAAELFRATLERPHGLRLGQCCDPVIDGEVCALLLRVEAAEATVEAVKVEISGDANFGRMVELLFYGPLREKEEELRLAHGKIAELEGELAERALGGEGK